MKLTLGEVAKYVDGEVVGESDTTISGVSEIQNASPGTITFLGNPLYSKYLKDTKADAIFVLDETKTSSPFLSPIDLHAKCSAVVPLVVVTPYLQLTNLLNFFSNFFTK